LRQIPSKFVLKQITFLLFVTIMAGFLLTGCSLEKKTRLNRSLQNLTAHYNILFDANQLLDQKQADYALAFIDSYNEILNVYPDTAATKSPAMDKSLAAAVDKGNKIINLKEQSHYIGDAYLVLGKANYLAGNYFDAVEYCSYVIRTFAGQTYLTQQALVWKARSLLYINQLPQARLVIDSAMQNIDPKKLKSSFADDVYATTLQYDINVQDYTGAEAMDLQAIQFCHNKNERLRWTFILAQLQELNHENDKALVNYARIAKSNVQFEMAFNAQLNRIRIEDNRNGVKTSRVARLRSLAKNPNNKEFQDQIYYQIAQLYLADKEYDNAIKNYKLSVRRSVKNQNQKGLSYLRIADINFNNKADYVNAKKYYDSTLTTLSPNYPGYQIIQKKTNNLQLLTDRLQIIAREDTLQMLAALDDKTRQTRIDTMVKHEMMLEAAQAAESKASKSSPLTTGGDVFAGAKQNSFYFYNPAAVSQGLSDFKKVWGDRKLEDDWRRSNKTQTAINPNVNVTSKALANGADAIKDQPVKSKVSATAQLYHDQLVQDLPLTPPLLAQSNLRMFNAYFDIANFYRDILGDSQGAIDTYELLLKRFPDNPNKPAIYYSLYRLYTVTKNPKADEYKDLLLKNYADTPFAKIIIDPDFSKKLNDKDAEMTAIYNDVYGLYAQRKYDRVIARVDSLMAQYPGNVYASQLGYLRTIAAGHQEPVLSFKEDLQQLLVKYPNDKLITPLINQHLNYINANLVDMSSRHFALLNTDPNEVPFTPPVENQKLTPYRKPGYHGYFATVPDVRAPVKKLDSVKAAAPVVAAKTLPVPDAPKQVDNTYVNTYKFSLRDSTDYFFVINISNDNTNLASSRFGIGQFNRANYEGKNISHQLMQAGFDNRLIFVGRFRSLAEVKAYARAIIPLMPEIMKIPQDKYSFFIITNENLNKLADKKTLDSYLGYYQNNY
jgi:hypothetical protein